MLNQVEGTRSQNLEPPAKTAPAAEPSTIPSSVEDRLIYLAESDQEQFAIVFPRVQKLMPDETSRACLRYLASHGTKGPGYRMSFWLGLNDTYLIPLLDPDFLSLDQARKAAAVLRQSDPWFLNKFLKRTEEPVFQKNTPSLSRALGLLPSLGDYSILLPWIRNATEHADERVRSIAVRALCQLRPNSAGIDRYRDAKDARVRANAIEAIWRVKGQGAANILREALNDPHHRVVVNALIGLYYQDDETAFQKLLELADHPSEMFRAAAIWALGHLRDPRAVPVLEKLAGNESEPLRSKVLKTLGILTFEPEPEIAKGDQNPIS